MEIHADSTGAKVYALDLEAEALLPALLPPEGDPTAGTHDPVPRQSIRPVQRPNG